MLALALAVAAAATLQVTPAWPYMPLLLLCALLSGLLVMLRLTLACGWVLLLAAVAGVLIGLDSAAPQIPGLRGDKVYVLLAGTVCAAVLLNMVASLLALALRRVLDGVPLRVLGAWISAGALLVLALSLKTGLL
ncbi:MAG: hypothetical protein R3E95_06005 [Thiolinea sp.]